MSNPYTSGPSGNGAKSISPEGKTGVMTTAVLFFILQTIAQGLQGLDTTDWSGWWVPLVNGAIAAAVGWISAYLKKNR
jgi:uncharacterized membrane protein HdeD (DUF308 family)